MSRLIDVDALIEALNNSDVQFDAEVNRIILEQPTAYDVDKVVENLETEAVCYATFDCWGKCEHCNNYAINRKDAIDIVKRGEIDD